MWIRIGRVIGTGSFTRAVTVRAGTIVTESRGVVQVQMTATPTARRRSLNSEILYRLETSLHSRRLDPEEMLARARAVRQNVGRPVTEEDLRRARSEGRP